MSDRLAELAEKHDVPRETMLNIVQDLQDPVAEPIVCEACGAGENPEEDRYVARVPLREGVDGIRCVECYVEHIDSETPLSRRESESVAWLLETDCSHKEIQRATGMGGSPGKYRRRAIKKYQEAKESGENGAIVPIMEALIHE